MKPESFKDVQLKTYKVTDEQKESFNTYLMCPPPEDPQFDEFIEDKVYTAFSPEKELPLSVAEDMEKISKHLNSKGYKFRYDGVKNGISEIAFNNTKKKGVYLPYESVSDAKPVRVKKTTYMDLAIAGAAYNRYCSFYQLTPYVKKQDIVEQIMADDSLDEYEKGLKIASIGSKSNQKVKELKDDKFRNIKAITSSLYLGEDHIEPVEFVIIYTECGGTTTKEMRASIQGKIRYLDLQLPLAEYLGIKVYNIGKEADVKELLNK